MRNYLSDDTKLAARLAKNLNLSMEHLNTLCEAAWSTWNYIAYDLFEANGGKNMSRSTVVEVVMDADYITSNNRNLPVEVVAVLKDYKQSDVVAQVLKKFVFTSRSYGL